ncbi:MAG: hypothetical protein WCP03_01245 [Candidatus Saccharibacteria bacterium]
MKKDTGQQSGIKDYWQATDAVSRPMAIALTILIMFICLAVIFSLFAGGRWLYGSISGKKNQPATVNQRPSGAGITDVGPTAASTTNKSAGSSGNANIAANPTPKATNTPKPIPNTEATSGSLPGTGPNELPNTGPSLE